MNSLDTNFLLANLIWGSVGTGYCIYGWKQKAMVPLFGGILMVAVSYFVESALMMSLICVAAIVAVYWLVKQGY